MSRGRLLLNGLVLLIVCTVTAAAPNPAHAQRRWRRPRTVHVARNRYYVSPTHNTHDQAVRAARYYYPKYTGAFNARYYDGIPSIYGTKPMRGTAW